VDENTGRILWARDMGRVVADGELAVAADGVFVLGTDNRLLRLDGATGDVLATTKLEGELRNTIRLAGGRVHVVLGIVPEGKRLSRDVLQVLDGAELTLLWEYGDQGRFSGGPGIDAGQVVIVGADGDAVLFR
jgi:outer membrane protein assembly factor BamB